MSEEHRTHFDGDMLRSHSFPLASALPLCPPVKAAMLAVEAILRREFIAGDIARERVRVEITRAVDLEIRRLVSVNENLFHDPRTDGPMQIMGVSFYVVDRLPEPGWRVRGVEPPNAVK